MSQQLFAQQLEMWWSGLRNLSTPFGNNFNGQSGVTFKLSVNDVALFIALVRRRFGQEHFETPC